MWRMIASDLPLPELSPEAEYPLEIDLDKGTIYDGDADDNFRLSPFLDVKIYTDREYGSTLDWAYCTEGRAVRIIEIIKSALQNTESVELWNFWLGGWAYDPDEEERPQVRTVTVPIADLIANDILEWDGHEVWKRPYRCGDRPTFYCLRVTRSP